MFYKFHTDGKRKIVCVAYVGKDNKQFRAVAKCSPNDAFDEEFGRQLAKSRVDLKIATHRLDQSADEYAELTRMHDEYVRRYDNWRKHRDQLDGEFVRLCEQVNDMSCGIHM